MMQRRNLMEEFEAKVYFRQIAEAIAYLHENEIAHGDVRLENIMWYPAYNIKMTAFSFTKRIGDCDKSKNRMLPHDYSYWMPEMLKGEEYDPMMADNWAAGVVVFTLINGCFPFDDKNRDAMLEAQQQQQFKNKHHVASGVFKDLLHEIFEPDIKERSTMAISLSHRWLKPVPNYAVEMLLTPRIKSAQFDKCDGDEEEGDDDMNSRVRSPIICS
ncbi:hypothetical protein B4U80_13274 [Leptotrombidium deliense]|uniref:Protein kinase domain-containing protein n=1 Tax=Leptotrombidium deliense TaxID=299467 RepID=A0A443S9A9_9ACAR|nr:hypothetical protein B4U80_13274 [Leptotrombidium deliense]